MSVIFGICRPSGETATTEELASLAGATERFAPDGTFLHVTGRLGMGFQRSHTSKCSRPESQPVHDAYGNVLVLDGRLDCQADLRNKLQVTQALTVSAFLLEAFRHWGEGCFSHLIGDWALALWSGSTQTLYLARDHAGTRTLFFQNMGGTLKWSTYLETFFVAGTSQTLDEDYAARFLGGIPIRNRSPYQGIRGVPPAHYLVIAGDTVTAKPHWNWMTNGRIRYRSEVEYEEHFFALFKTSVERRTAQDDRILAHLSGGMDSTSIVCMSDHIRGSEPTPATNLIDTLSFYDDTEPSWNERPYFSLVETKRGKMGIHVDTSSLCPSFVPVDPSQGILLFPGPDANSIVRDKEFHALVRSRGYQAILSGVGGDELLGGIPTPLPELADYLVSGEFRLLLSRTMEWCLANRDPYVHTLFATVKFMLNLYRQPRGDPKKMPPWIRRRLRDRCRDAWLSDVGRGRRLGLTPTAISNGLSWWSVLESLPHLIPSLFARCEYRYPYLDRDLVDFLFSIPSEQLVRPGQRRSLMRRALKQIVPPEILGRRRKAYVIHGPLRCIQSAKDEIQALFADSCAAQYGFVDPFELRSALELTAKWEDPRWWQALMRTIVFELWLRNTQRRSALPKMATNVEVHAPVCRSSQAPVRLGFHLDLACTDIPH